MPLHNTPISLPHSCPHHRFQPPDAFQRVVTQLAPGRRNCVPPRSTDRRARVHASKPLSNLVNKIVRYCQSKVEMSPLNCAMKMSPTPSFLSLFSLPSVEGFGREPLAHAMRSWSWKTR